MRKVRTKRKLSEKVQAESGLYTAHEAAEQKDKKEGYNGMRMFLRFISWIPAYYRLFKRWYFYPDDIDFALTNYEKALYEITGGRLSKILYSAPYIVGCVREHFCDDCDERKEPGNG